VLRDLVVTLDLTTQVGWAVFFLDGTLLDSGAWNLEQPSSAHDGEFWASFRVALMRLLAKYEGRVVLIAFERPVMYGHWAVVRIAFGQAALVELTAARFAIPTTMVSPSNMKKVVTGNGRATKDEVREHVIRITGDLKTEQGGTTKGERKLFDKLRGDETDARAVGIVVTRKFDPEQLRSGRLVERT
jgi:Holliday junction resolvasome RuvABC endonuclease subunit